MGSSVEERDESAVQRAIEQPANFVLKPQREGGGNNLYDSEVQQYPFLVPIPISRFFFLNFFFSRLLFQKLRHFFLKKGLVIKVELGLSVAEFGCGGDGGGSAQ